MLESSDKIQTESVTQIKNDQPYFVSVRSLVEFVLQAGDLTVGEFQKRDPDGQGEDLFLSARQLRPASMRICPWVFDKVKNHSNSSIGLGQAIISAAVIKHNSA